MTIIRPVVAGAVVALAEHGLVVGFTIALATAAGGGPNADVDAGGRFAALFFGVFAYGIAQLVLLGNCFALSGRLGRGSSSGLVAGWILGLAASLYYLCGGFGT
ncbi:hypothetical protein O7600_07840 [Micromonospora sp. WMMA1998]|uniref:hypothetical protein n=1 Tax=unclassified Micromonospora TaxID=2617518 RepID=UPI00248BF60C|nr:hypothetical protein [Micromonospora sp. WMMA1998]WBC16740.1 hypothetical protein O7600_07840 [Micromonospora sp. WMMA1998]